MMIKRYKQVCSKIFFGAVILLSMGNLFAGDKIGDIYASASDNAKVIGHASNVTTDSLTQNQGGHGGHVVVYNTATQSRLPVDIAERFAEGERFLKRQPPSWEEALEAFRYAADQTPPHFNSCLRCAEYFWKVVTPPNVYGAKEYYSRALTVTDHDSSLVHIGFMRMYFTVGSATSQVTVGSATSQERMKKAYLRKAAEHCNNLLADSVLDLEDYEIVDKLEKLGLVPSSTGSEVDSVASALSAATLTPAPATKVGGGGPDVVAVDRAVRSGPEIPVIASGYEDIYLRFLGGKLIYRPNSGSDAGKIELPIAALLNPLNGVFDLSGCGDTGNYLSINTGYRKGKNPANANKVEIWFAPRFLIEKEGPRHFGDIIGCWDNEEAPIGIFWTWGGWTGLTEFDHSTTQNWDILSTRTLLELWQHAPHYARTYLNHPTPFSSHTLITHYYSPHTLYTRKISCCF